jgi:periplasmic copper chaperone A
MQMRSRLFRTAAIGGALTLALAAPAAAHITVDPAEGPSDGFATVNFQVPHGCEESPTTRVRIKIPPSVPSVTPGRNPYYELTTKEGRKDKVELHGETVTRGISEIIYTAETPLPPHDLDILPVSVKLPAGKAGETVWFPVIQECAEGRTGWVQIPAEGESADDLENPAPGVTLTAAGGGHGGGEAQGEEPTADVEPAAAATEDEGGDDGAPVWLAVVALVLAALALLAGIGGLLAARRA